jgi:hypothetical protein
MVPRLREEHGRRREFNISMIAVISRSPTARAASASGCGSREMLVAGEVVGSISNDYIANLPDAVRCSVAAVRSRPD